MLLRGLVDKKVSATLFKHILFFFFFFMYNEDNVFELKTLTQTLTTCVVLHKVTNVCSF